ncbi:Uncharacterised protein [Legionella busanensis]|uniref:Uncharacterized protein n=1 Tax=Legionella busanensis TaxID=190655 RepID=A0A378JQC2_9GAMM|nr:hypothetical protein [Legionella busanensis]STX50322.1 Uncharacterised protein [Legionella busanensis]
MSKKKLHTNSPKQQFNKLTQQYLSLMDNLTRCTNERSMKILLKQHIKVVKRIGQDQLTQENLIQIQNLDFILQKLKEFKAKEFGISIEQEALSPITEEKPTLASSVLTKTEDLNVEPDAIKQSEPNMAAANYNEGSNHAENNPETLLQTSRIKNLTLNIGFNQSLPIEQRLQKPEKANYEEMLAWLNNQGAVGEGLSQVLTRLHKGTQHRWNPYWQNASDKLNKILDALNNLSPYDSLANELDDKNSELYQAINMPRIKNHFSLFRHVCGVKPSKSLQKIEALDNDLQGSPTI